MSHVALELVCESLDQRQLWIVSRCSKELREIAMNILSSRKFYSLRTSLKRLANFYDCCCYVNLPLNDMLIPPNFRNIRHFRAHDGARFAFVHAMSYFDGLLVDSGSSQQRVNELRISFKGDTVWAGTVVNFFHMCYKLDHTDWSSLTNDNL
jgi:hypothetical protein